MDGKQAQTLLIDADDTLWENNVLFERAIAVYTAFLDGALHSPQEVREHLDRVERQTIARHGYGTESFRRSLLQCFEDLVRQPPTEAQHLRVMSFVDEIVHAEIELLPGVRDAVRELGGRHRLILVTKGHDLEQREKLKRSGLEADFSAVEVLAEKNRRAYQDVAEKHSCSVQSTWMVGNSPRSDINPALEAGLNAVFVPHPQTWVLEQEVLMAVPPGQQLLELSSLRELALVL